jgi:uncharacterized C2H2 Zn-finger protein
MSLFLYRALCPHCGAAFELRWHQKIAHLVRVGSMKLLRCPRCKTVGMCKGV